MREDKRKVDVKNPIIEPTKDEQLSVSFDGSMQKRQLQPKINRIQESVK